MSRKHSDHRPARASCADGRLRAIALLFATLVAAALVASCGGSSLARRSDGVAARPTQGAPLSGHASVRGSHPVYVARAAEILRASGLFESVRESESPEADADVAFRVWEISNRANPIPLITGVTLGVVPIYGMDMVGMRFRIVRPKHLRGTSIIVRQHRRWGMGWVFAPSVLDPDWDSIDLRESERLGHQFRRVVDEANAVDAFGSGR